MATDIEWAWLTGLFEGEGCITFTGRNSVAITIGMTDRDVVDRAAEVAGVGKVYAASTGRPKTMYVWRASAAPDVTLVIERMLPILGERRTAKAKEALARIAGVRRAGYCKRDHEFTPDNTYTSPGGQRFCRACLRLRDQTRRSKNIIKR